MGIDRQEALRRYAAGESSVTISQALGIPQGTIRRWATEEKVKWASARKVSPEAVAEWGEKFEAAAHIHKEFPLSFRGGRGVYFGPPPRTHMVIPDTQCRPGEDLSHLYWAGRYAAERRPDAIIHIGDHFDYPSLSSYEKKGSHYYEGKRLSEDTDAGAKGMDLFRKGIESNGPYDPELEFTLGNHCRRFDNLLNENPNLIGSLVHPRDILAGYGWRVHDFLKPIIIDGVTYAHYMYNPNTGRPYSGSVDTMLRNIGYSFTMGHQQGLRWGRRELGNGSVQIGLVCGSYYQHDEEYRGPQARGEWRGVVMKHEVRDGNYDPMFVSASFLKRKFS